jgi:hypothetical protein
MELKWVGENQRLVETTGANINLTRKDPFGFWFISFDKGAVPEKLTSAYTSLDQASIAIANYLDMSKTRSAKVSE